MTIEQAISISKEIKNALKNTINVLKKHEKEVHNLNTTVFTKDEIALIEKENDDLCNLTEELDELLGGY